MSDEEAGPRTARARARSEFTHGPRFLFVSDGMGYRFTHSLENVVKSTNSAAAMVDFEAVESMDGTFIANRYHYIREWEGIINKDKDRHKKLREITDDDVEKGLSKMKSKEMAESKRASIHNAEAGR